MTIPSENNEFYTIYKILYLDAAVDCLFGMSIHIFHGNFQEKLLSLRFWVLIFIVFS